MTAAAAVLRGHAGFIATASPLYRDLMLRLADDIDAGGPAAAVVDGEAPADWQDAFALRLMAAVHRAVLERRAPALALHYPSVGGDGSAELAWPALRALMVEQPEQLRRDLARPCQTNDPGRSAALLAGLLQAVQVTGVGDVRLLEIGASAGLNLRVDAFRVGDRGPADSPCVVADPWPDGQPPRPAWRLVDRRGCDPDPVDPTSAGGRLALTASVWADHLPRFERLRGALEVARRVPAWVDRSGAADWLPDRLATPREDVLTVVWHSVVRQYVDPVEWAEVEATIAAAPGLVAHVAMEPAIPPDPDGMAVTVSFAGEAPVRVATAGPHGPPVRLAVPTAVRMAVRMA